MMDTAMRLTAYTTEQVAGLFQVTPEQVVRWCGDGVMPFFFLPDKTRRYPRAKIDRILKAETNNLPATAAPRPPLAPIQYAQKKFGVRRTVILQWINAGLISYIDVPMVGRRLFRDEVDALYASSVTARLVDYDLYFATRDLTAATVEPDAW